MLSESYNSFRNCAEHVMYERWFIHNSSTLLATSDPKALLRRLGNCGSTQFGVATPLLRIPASNVWIDFLHSFGFQLRFIVNCLNVAWNRAKIYYGFTSASENEDISLNVATLTHQAVTLGRYPSCLSPSELNHHPSPHTLVNECPLRRYTSLLNHVSTDTLIKLIT